MAKSHQDKVAVISGAASGIGQAFAHRLAQDGAHIVIADVLPAAETVRLVEEAGRHVLAWKGDVSSEGSVNHTTVCLFSIAAHTGGGWNRSLGKASSAPLRCGELTT